jgi:hypothetical protein
MKGRNNMQNRRDVTSSGGTDQVRETEGISGSNGKRKWEPGRDATKQVSPSPEQERLTKMARIALSEGSSDQVIQGKFQSRQDGDTLHSEDGPPQNAERPSEAELTSLVNISASVKVAHGRFW